MIFQKDKFCGHRPNGNSCDVCYLKKLANQLNRVLAYEESVTNQWFFHLMVQYLLASFRCQTYFHIGPYPSINSFPRLFHRMSLCILDPACDLEILLSAYHMIIASYTDCLKDLSLSEHVFSSDDNALYYLPAAEVGKFSHVKTRFSFVIGLYWEDAYNKVLKAAHKSFKYVILPNLILDSDIGNGKTSTFGPPFEWQENSV